MKQCKNPARLTFGRIFLYRILPIDEGKTPAMSRESDHGVAEHVAHVQEDIAAGNGLAVVSIAKSYDKRVVLSDVSLSVGKGEAVGLLGPNGAGKTTCFYSIMGLVKPDAGRIMLDGADITALPMYRRAILGLGYLPQETSIFRGMTVEQNIEAVLELAEPNKDARKARLDELLGEFGLTRLRSSASMVARATISCSLTSWAERVSASRTMFWAFSWGRILPRQPYSVWPWRLPDCICSAAWA